MKRVKTPTFLLELPLRIDWSQERQVRAHLEAARCLYNGLLSQAMKRLTCMRNDPAWTSVCALPHSLTQAGACTRILCLAQAILLLQRSASYLAVLEAQLLE